MLNDSEKKRFSKETDRLRFLDGASLEMELFNVSHGNLWFKVITPEHREAGLYFAGTWLMNCPTVMHEIRLRQANEVETERTMSLLNSELIQWLRKEDLYTIDCQEGIYSIWASTMEFEWEYDKSNNYVELLLQKPLWKNGPSLQQILLNT